MSDFSASATRDDIVLSRNTGTWALHYCGRMLLCDATARLETEGLAQALHLAEMEHGKGSDRLGLFVSLDITFTTTDGLRLVYQVRLYPDRPGVAIRTTVGNDGSGDVRLTKVLPLVCKIQLSPAHVSIMSNDWERCGVSSNLQPADSAGQVDAAWSIAVESEQDRTGMAVGVLSGNTMFTSFSIDRGESTHMALQCIGDTRSGTRGVLLRPGEALEADTIYLAPGHDGSEALVRYGEALRDHLDEPVRRPRTAGWCDWYHRYGVNSEDTVLQTLEAIDAKLKDCGIEYIQIDSGWQRVRELTHYPELDLTCGRASGAPWEPHESFPNGMKYLADEIHRRGYKAGLWIRPFCVTTEAEEYKRGESWVLPWRENDPNPDGTSIDVSDSAAVEWVGNIAQTVAHDWGYDYIKFDFVAFDVLAKGSFDLPRSELGTLQVGNERQTSAQSFRRALEVMRERAGRDVFLLACNCFAGSAMGLVDGFRVSGDVYHGSWDLNRKMLRACADRYFLDGTVWQNDPDVLHVRDSLPLNEAVLWASFVGLSGAMVLLGDAVEDLSEERIGILRRIFPLREGRAHPLRLFKESPPSVWHLPIEKDFVRWDVIGLYNWSDELADVGLDFEEAGLDPAREYHVFDFWRGTYEGRHRECYSCSLAPRHCRVLSLRESLDIPQIVGTDHHITQGGFELADERWEASEHALTANLRGRPGDVFSLYLHVPAAYALATAQSAPAHCTVVQNGDVISVTFTVASSGVENIALLFAEEES